jgi:hypothetical protein
MINNTQMILDYIVGSVLFFANLSHFTSVKKLAHTPTHATLVVHWEFAIDGQRHEGVCHIITGATLI